jgi:amidase
MSRSWQDVVAYKRQSLKDAIPAEWVVPPSILPPPEQTDVSTFIAESGWFSTAEKAILSLSAAQLLPRLASGRVSAEEVTRAFCKSAAAAQQLVSLTESRVHATVGVSVATAHVSRSIL